MELILKPLAAALAILLGIIGLAGPAAAPTSVEAGGSPAAAAAARRLAVSWVRDVDRGNARAACELQIVGEVGGRPCDALPTMGTVIYCPEIPASPRTRHLAPAQQVRRVVTDRRTAQAVIVGRVEPDRFHGLLRLTRQAARWRVSSFEYGGTRLDPAGLVFEGDSPAAYRLSPPCE